ncbi:2-methylene-furan-3-one reductase [Aspergillus lentulus]|uniref:2-methylene-furan-3-one reductase n=1 Tax=Aspergillus lentulus TaxID=293939 RepID=A0AAN4PV40_ASPLE|nr:2-methylene-furan-3-one reductase [Aspergillus lentulus]
MLSINVPAYSKPSGYQLSEVPKPEIQDPKDVLIKVHAASINPIDVKKADGILKFLQKDAFPYKIGYDCAGTVVEIGAGVTRFKVGDAVYVRLPETTRGSWSEYAKCAEDYIALKPPSLSFESAASIPLAGMTALQALRKYDGDLTGKTVFVPAGLSGTGLYACQLAKHVFNAGKVITTVSTSKVAKVDELLGEGTVDQIIDYKKEDPKTVIQHGTVDFLFDTAGVAMEYLCLMRPKTSWVVSIATSPSGNQLQDFLEGRNSVPIYVKFVLNLLDSIRKIRARCYGVSYTYMFLHENGKDLDAMREYVEDGKLKTVVGTTVDMSDIQAVRAACEVVYSNQGGLGKAVIKVAQSEN